jgi:hypothetical protein
MRLPLFACCLAAACGGSSTDWFPSDLDKHAVIATAGEVAAAKACMAFEDYLYGQYRDSLLVEAVCTAVGIDQTDAAAACADFVQGCIDNPPASVQALITSVVDATGCGGLDYQPTGCGKTLAELAERLDAAEAELKNLRLRLECSTAGQPLPADALSITPPAACTSLELACPTPG